MNWFMFLLFKKYRKECKLRKEYKILQQFEDLYIQLESNYPDLSKSLWHPELKIGKYEFAGGWLRESFYLDVMGKKDIGRIYVGPDLFSPKVRWNSLDLNNNTYLFKSDSVDKVSLAKAINAIIPGLIKEKQP